MDFYITGIKNLFHISKNVLIVMVPILINEDVFEPSYNGLKCLNDLKKRSETTSIFSTT